MDEQALAPAGALPVRVMLVDDHAVVREGYRRLLQTEPGLQVVAEAGQAEDALDWLAAPVPGAALVANGGGGGGGGGGGAPGLPPQQASGVDVLVLDLSMPGRGGMELLRQVRQRWPALGVLVFSMHDGPPLVAQALRAGALGYVTKSSAPEDLVHAVRGVAARQLVLSPDVAQVLHTLREQQARDQAPAHLALTPRELDVLRELVRGAPLDEAATRLAMSAKTVANHQSAIRAKLGVSTAVELLRYVREHQLFPGEPW